jgi:hypothetical protein
MVIKNERCVRALFLLILSLATLSCGSDKDEPTIGPPTPTPGNKISVVTDKTNYEPGETIKISVTNNLDTPVWYAQQVECGLPFWLLADCDGAETPYWEHLCQWAEPDYRFTKLDPGETMSSSQYPYGNWSEFNLTEPGCYEIVFPYSLEEETIIEWAGSRIDEYSNEFTVQ